MYSAANLGFPRIGKNRELKFALEKYWRQDSSLAELRQAAHEIRKENWRIQQNAGIKHIPCGDFSLYDHVLDHAFMVGAIPPRFKSLLCNQPEELTFSMARGTQKTGEQPIAAMEMTKWFNTNYHYIVPEIGSQTAFSLQADKLFDEINEALALDIPVRPVILGPVSFLLLSKSPVKKFNPLSRLSDLTPIYAELLNKLQKKSLGWVQLDEPFLSMDLNDEQKAAYLWTFKNIGQLKQRPKIMLSAYFADLNLNSNLIQQSPFEGIHIDLSCTSDSTKLAATFSEIDTLSLGILNGRNIWREDLSKAVELVRSISEKNSAQSIQITPSCSLLHLPYDIEREDGIDAEIRGWMAFAEQKLEMLSVIEDELNNPGSRNERIRQNQEILSQRRSSKFVNDVKHFPALTDIDTTLLNRNSAYPARRKKQESAMQLPVLPTTTIGSFPQTREVRRARSDWRKNVISNAQYEDFLKEEIKRTVAFQEEIGVDLLVHGEFERNDMVQFFGEQLSGFTFSRHGWVQSYGSRYVRPPIIFGDVSRPAAMTVKWTTYAQSLTKKPMKGMLTGPVTIMLWSFIRDDQPLLETCKQIAFAIREEVIDLEATGVKAIQIDEPALREGLPLQRREWDEYLDWTVKCFRIASSSVEDKTQIHTHMCYAEFNDIIDAIIALDADVISVEASRSKMELLDAFKDTAYPNEIGPGVYDIHSPTIPDQTEIEELLEKALMVIPRERLWVNPDCGLKTRRWEEVKLSLQHMVAAAKTIREKGQ